MYVAKSTRDQSFTTYVATYTALHIHTCTHSLTINYQLFTCCHHINLHLPLKYNLSNDTLAFKCHLHVTMQ